jgi:copper(I)-binding protein
MSRRVTIAVLVLGAFLQPTAAHEITVGDIEVIHPFVKETSPKAKVGGGYMVLRNNSDVEDRLVAIESPDAASVKIDRTVVGGDGVARMEHVVGGVVVPAHGVARLGAEDGIHAMFDGLKQPFGLGMLIDATLVFERAGRIPITLEVEPMNANVLQLVHAH